MSLAFSMPACGQLGEQSINRAPVNPFAIAEALGFVVQASDKLEGSFLGMGRLREITGYSRRRRFRFDPYLRSLRSRNTDEVIRPVMYVHEPPGNVYTWKAIGSEPCVIHVEVNGRIEHLDQRGAVVKVVDPATYRQMYLEWRARTA